MLKTLTNRRPEAALRPLLVKSSDKANLSSVNGAPPVVSLRADLNRASASHRSLRQGQARGTTERRAANLLRSPHAESAVVLRRCDDSAKVPDLVVPGIEEYVPSIERVVTQP